MTDVLSGPELVEKAFVYLTSLTKECRKVVTAKFQNENKGQPFKSVEPILRQEIESWFSRRDKNIAIKHEKSSSGRPGEILMTYAGKTKDASFKFHVDGLFTVSGSTDAPSYLKSMNIYVDKREFTR